MTTNLDLKVIIEKMKVKANETIDSINSKQSAIITLMNELKELTNSSIEKAKVYEDMAKDLLNMAEDLRDKAEDIKDWGLYDASFEEEEEEDDDDLIVCDNCGKEMQWEDEIIYDAYGWGFCCDECKENFHKEDEEIIADIEVGS